MREAFYEFIAKGSQLTGPRNEQNDAYSFGPRCLVVADGMGAGEGPGMVASEVAAYYGRLPEDSYGAHLEEALRQAPDELGHLLLAQGHEDGSTVSAAVLTAEGDLWMTNAGDSMTVLIRGARTLYSNPLHNVPMSADGDQQATNPYQLNRYIAPMHSFAPELVRFVAEAGDIVILMSDGVHTNLATGDLVEIVQNDRDPASIGYEILRRAASKTLKDNATCVVASVHQTEGVS